MDAHPEPTSSADTIAPNRTLLKAFMFVLLS
jgi:hypothetical protein